MLYLLSLLLNGSKSKLIALLTAYTLSLHIQCKDKNTVDLTSCTAVYISPTEALTAAHCMENTTGKMWVKDSNNKSFSAVISQLDKKLDLCLIKIKAHPHKFASIGAPITRGESIYLVSSEEDIPFTYSEGVVENIILDPTNGTLSIFHSASILGGASGSWLFNNKGQLVGINTASYRAISSTVDIEEVKYFLTGKLR